ncbi:MULTISPECIES: histidine--tRNA ligase [Thermoactinomyces]|jgi:histidyl-tRNA synthetase|uniref:Histidine--tRNA ligase n=1 Tax=Thermoactinomyces vulgaris TaxID=2026 RepID=A0ABS0QGX1_THEVU|nr:MULTISPECIES: histidine--tRNA ligase [Thermoactinomyces]KFZ39913.1 histidyl-tRNA synthetase [Thermoactinomyces sp. Gus2-1]KYQ86723.1 histidine--tRNA ligase [Thermoactinomyces sp. AS95]MBA4550747.1 histidine--tRNA ligase [Thermoactinomyces vulgaris]MBA4596194.1 histidine--tRNA ligase [Thermoactinomyces vulgaris]MBH8583073.1 histidine--tRNA ligase [Thermoactinomyces sp. CICC 10735]
MKYQASPKYFVPRGTDDLLPGEVEKWQWMEETARKICRLYGFREIRTPLFEHTEIYQRGVGEATDIVEKEMYSFYDRGERALTLRPEGTAGVVRSFVEKKVFADPQPTKWYYIGPMFRYENPQAGRRRQFHQFGVEVFGSADPALDAEVIALGMHFYQALGLKDVRVEINSVGDQETRERYRRRLIDYFEPVKESLSKEARERLYKNPLRILDSKDPKTKEIAMEAPSILDDLSEPARQHFEQVKSYLDVLKIPYVINDRLVRGLDYYTHTAFEFMVDVPGAQAGTIGGGGRYNGLVEEFGGPEMPGFGFGIGLERVLLALEEQKVEIPVEDGIDCYLITIGEKAKTAGAKWLKALREAGIAADQDYLGRKMKAQFKAADRSNARFAVILGEDEMEQGRINVKHLDSGEQETIELEQLIPYIKANIRRR